MISSYQGGCRFPYVSEVSRSGLRQWIFIIASILGGIPWIIFSFSYFGVFIRYAPQISNKFQRIIFQCLQFITLVFNILAAIGVLATAIFDMGHFPTVHPYVQSPDHLLICRPSAPSLCLSISSPLTTWWIQHCISSNPVVPTFFEKPSLYLFPFLACLALPLWAA